MIAGDSWPIKSSAEQRHKEELIVMLVRHFIQVCRIKSREVVHFVEPTELGLFTEPAEVIISSRRHKVTGIAATVLRSSRDKLGCRICLLGQRQMRH
jgi:hypothetical protein